MCCLDLAGIHAPPVQEWIARAIASLLTNLRPHHGSGLQEADEAFSAIEYALTQQLDALERQTQAQQAEAEGQAAEGLGGSGDSGADPEFRAMWLGTLADTRAAFLDMVRGCPAVRLCRTLDFPGFDQGPLRICSAAHTSASAGCSAAQRSSPILRCLPQKPCTRPVERGCSSKPPAPLAPWPCLAAGPGCSRSAGWEPPWRGRRRRQRGRGGSTGGAARHLDSVGAQPPAQHAGRGGGAVGNLPARGHAW